MNLSTKQRVAYIPRSVRAKFDAGNPVEGIEYGYVSSKNDHYTFVKFDKNLQNNSWNNVSGIACDPNDLIDA